MDSQFQKATFAGLLLLLLLFSTSLYAFPVTVSSVAADWSNVQDEFSVVTYYDTDGITGNEEIRWGEPASDQGQSGYRFDGAAPPDFTVETGDIFSLGDFTHTNQPVWGSITGAQLDITLELMIGSETLNEGPFSFSFIHDETTNDCSPQPECANDLVSLASLSTSSIFMVDDVEYTLQLIGFSVNDVFMTDFSTFEGQTNTAQLLAMFTTAESVPAPPAFILMALGLLGIALSRKSQRPVI